MTTRVLPLAVLLLVAAVAAASPSAAFLHLHAPPRRRLKAPTAASSDDAITDDKPSLFVFGLGYVGRRLAQAVAAQGGWRVQGTSTKPNPAGDGGGGGVASFAFDPLAGRALEAEGLAALEGATHLLVSIPPLALSETTETEDAVLACYGETLQRRCPRLRWVGYLSSTSVYGDRGGGWVSEADPLQPVSAQGRARVRAEEGWRALAKGCNGVQLDVFRLAGIYGPGRSALDTLRREVAAQQQQQAGAQWPLTFRVDAERPVSRVHVADIVRALRCAMDQQSQREGGEGGVFIYNVADDRPASRLEVFSFAAGLLASLSSSSVVEVAAKEEEEEGGSVGNVRAGAGRTRSNRQPESKRVDNRRVKEALLARCFPGEGLLYKDYGAGLAAIWEEEEGMG